jgi:uncharacterized protein YqeY
MGIYDNIPNQLKDAMRARDKERLQALRNIRAALMVEQKASGADTVSDEQCIEVLRRLGKQRQESIDAFEAAGRDEAAAEERAELAVIEEFLPRLADEATTRAWVAAAVASTGAKGPGDMGKVMGALMKAHKAELDGKLANQLVRAALA